MSKLHEIPGLGNVSGNEVIDLFECPVCYNYMTPPINQCVNGHLVCHDCFPECKKSPVCKAPKSKTENLAMHKLTHMICYPCNKVYKTYFNFSGIFYTISKHSGPKNLKKSRQKKTRVIKQIKKISVNLHFLAVFPVQKLIFGYF